MFTSEAIENQSHLFKVRGTCIITGKLVEIIVRRQALIDYYEKGMKAQDAFHDLTPGQREFFISGCSEEGWAQLYGESENDDNL